MVFENVIGQNEESRSAGEALLRGHSKVLRYRVDYEMRQVHVGDVEGYSFEVAYRGERAICMVACDRRQAYDMFFSLLRGRVTPCSFVYVMQEIAQPGAMMDQIDIKNKILC